MKNVIKIILILGLTILWTGTASGIDKTQKGSSSQGSGKTTVNNQNKSTQDSQAQPDSKSSDNSRKTHDDFIDRNNNGIDDRAEKSTSSAKAKKDQPVDKKVDTKKRR